MGLGGVLYRYCSTVPTVPPIGTVRVLPVAGRYTSGIPCCSRTAAGFALSLMASRTSYSYCAVLVLVQCECILKLEYSYPYEYSASVPTVATAHGLSAYSSTVRYCTVQYPLPDDRTLPYPAIDRTVTYRTPCQTLHSKGTLRHPCRTSRLSHSGAVIYLVYFKKYVIGGRNFLKINHYFFKLIFF